MRAVKGIYENGVISLLEKVPLQAKQEVLVLVPEQGDTAAVKVLKFAGMLSDLSAEEAAAFDAAVRREVRFARTVQP